MDTTNKKLPVLLAGGVVAAVALWMLSGLGKEPEVADIGQARSSASAIQQVRVQTLRSHQITREIVLSARTEPNRFVELRAEAEGVVARIDAQRGDVVKAGTVLLALDRRDRDAQLAEAVALVAQRELEYNAILNLRDRQFTTPVQIAEALAQLESARAARARTELEIRNTTPSAPFDGVLQDRGAEIGDFIRVGDVVAQVVDLDPLIIAGEVNEREVASLAVGSEGKAVLVDGSELTGTVRYLAPVAEMNTRSFLVELAVPNPGYLHRAGLTAELRLYANALKVHTLSPALLSLADDGTVGVKVVGNDNTVRFYPVEISGSSAEGTHVTGLPDSIRLITVGQGFVTEGQKVIPIEVSSPESAAAHERTD